MLSFATIQEAFDVPDIRKAIKKKTIKQENFQNPPLPPPQQQEYSYVDDKLQARNELYNNKEFNMNIPGCDNSVNAPTYTYPISQETRNKADQAMQEFLRSQTINKPIRSNLDKLQSYMEDDMDMYLDISQLGNVQKQEPPHQTDPTPPPAHPVIEQITTEQQAPIMYPPNPPSNSISNLPQPVNACSPNVVYVDNGNKKNSKISDIYLELFIFLFIGLIIITLCEMIVRIAKN